MSFLILRREEKQTGPVPATGVHAELLAEIEEAAKALLKFLALERIGTYHADGRDWWTRSDPLMERAQVLVKLIERRAGEVRDVGPRRS